MSVKQLQIGVILHELCTKGDLDRLNMPVDCNRTISAYEAGILPQMPSYLYFALLCDLIKLDSTRSVVALVLAERLCKKTQNTGESKLYHRGLGESSPIALNSLTVHRIMLTSVLIT